MSKFSKFFTGIALSFGAPWLALIVIPTIWGQRLQPEPYDQERDGMAGAYPQGQVYRQGQLVYLNEGCNNCHTQVIRPSFDGVMDGWKLGWGADQSDTPRQVVRPSTPRDYLHEPIAPLGIQRNGPDLANAGYRFGDDNALYVKLFAPRSQNSWSTMPSYRHLFKVQKIQGLGSADALILPEEFAPEEGYEVVPTEKARLMVKYIKSLKKDEPLPGQVPQDG